LAAYVKEPVVIRYDPRDISEIRVFHKDQYLCKAVDPDHANATVSLKDVQMAHAARRRELRGQINQRIAVDADPQPASTPNLTTPFAHPSEVARHDVRRGRRDSRRLRLLRMTTRTPPDLLRDLLRASMVGRDSGTMVPWQISTPSARRLSPPRRHH